jgi:hypothetical protein
VEKVEAQGMMSNVKATQSKLPLILARIGFSIGVLQFAAWIYINYGFVVDEFPNWAPHFFS